MLRRLPRLLAAIGGVCLLSALIGTSPVAARAGISMTFAVSPSSGAAGKTVTWTMVLTPSGVTYKNLGIDWGPWSPGLTVSGCNFSCQVDARTGHVDWTLPSVGSRTVVHLYTTSPPGSAGSVAATAYISTPVVCLNGCGSTLTVFLIKPAAKVSMRVSPASALPRLQTVGCGLPNCHYVDFTASFTYISLSNLSCAFSTPVTWDGRTINGGSIALHTYSGPGCTGSVKLRQEGWGLSPGRHRVCAGSTDQPGLFGDIACATFTVVGVSAPAPTPKPTIAPRPSMAPSAGPSAVASTVPSAEPTVAGSAAPSAVAVLLASPSTLPSGGPTALSSAADHTTPPGPALWIAGAIALGLLLGISLAAGRRVRRWK
jgi:hypothetical protein